MIKRLTLTWELPADDEMTAELGSAIVLLGPYLKKVDYADEEGIVFTFDGRNENEIKKLLSHLYLSRVSWNIGL